ATTLPGARRTLSRWPLHPHRERTDRLAEEPDAPRRAHGAHRGPTHHLRSCHASRARRATSGSLSAAQRGRDGLLPRPVELSVAPHGERARLSAALPLPQPADTPG